MNTHPTAQQRGVALIIVLAMLVLLSGLIIGFFASVTTERQASTLATGSIQARQIADTTVNLAITQIRDATSQSDDGAAWATQPGVVRTFKKAGIDIYKLYSADKMIESESDFEGTSLKDGADSFWPSDSKDKRYGYVDLNEPAASSDGTLTYPIIHPMAKFGLDGKSTTDLTKRLVEGFDCADLTNTAGDPILPLNVKWLYVLKDGSIGTLETLAASSDTAKRPSRSNPVVGRTAFWADDETAKLNLNTASEPTFWDTPHVSTLHEIGDVSTAIENLLTAETSLNLSVSQPVQGEYPRYPGHPAQTSLSPVLRRLTTTAVTHSDKIYKDLVYRLVPHVYSDAYPTRAGWSTNLSTAAGTLNKSTSGKPILPDDGDRLFASVDEMMFVNERRKPDGSLLENGGSASAPFPNLTPKLLDRMRFFLTTQSRAPELNLWGRPRVAIWPIPDDPSKRTYFDKAFAFTSTISPGDASGGAKDAKKQLAYYFTRRVLAPSGGTGATNPLSGSRSATLDYTLVDTATGRQRNQDIYNYLQQLTGDDGKDIPGFKGNFKKKYGLGNDRDQILTEIFDYIRCTSLLDGTGRDQNGAAKPGAFAATRYTVPYNDGTADTSDAGGANKPNEWSGQVMPAKIGATQGLGRFLTLSEVAVCFFVPLKDGYASGTDVTATAAEGANTMRAVLLFEFATPTAGYVGLRDTYSFKVYEVDPLQVEADQDAGPRLKTEPFGKDGAGLLGTCIGEVDALNTGFARPHTPNRGFTLAAFQWTTTGPSDASSLAKTFVESGSTAADRKKYPFLSKAIKIKAAKDGKFTMKGGTYKVELYAGTDPIDSALVQTINFTIAPDSIASIDFPKPNMVESGTFPGPTPPAGTKKFIGRIFEANIREGSTTPIFGNGPLDIVRSTAVKNGDYRLTSTMSNVAKELFEPPGGSDSKTSRIVHTLRYGHGDPAPENPTPAVGSRGKFGVDGEIRGSKPPDLSGSVNGVQRKDGGPGDWTRGVSKHVDGPLANKPDEGNTKFDLGQTGIYRLPYMRGPNSRLADDTNFSPNRLIPSPVMFGGLPTETTSDPHPWQTLLFRPDRHKSGERDHPGGSRGGAQPPDHLLLDLFWMPVVEPYAISEPCSTAGKINLNFAIAPFGYLNKAGTSYVQRDTGIRGVLKGVKMMAVPTKMPNGGHREGNTSETDGGSLATGVNGPPVRFDIDPDFTIRDMAERQSSASKGGIYRSASEVCDVDLYPYSGASANVPPGADKYPGTGPKTASDLGNFWDDNRLTGDIGRENPYNMIYPRVTTKSNTFTVHMRSQVVQFPPSYYAAGATGALNVGQIKTDFTTKGDVARVASEYRGSATVERFIDPNDPALVAYNRTAELNNSLDPYYRFRIVNTKRFSP